MSNEEKFIYQLTTQFNIKKGKASCYCYNPIKPKNIILYFVGLHRQRHPDTTILIIVRDYDERKEIVDLLTKNNLYNNINVLSILYLKPYFAYKAYLTLIIGINDNFELINNLEKNSKFTFNILTEYNNDETFNSNVDKILSFIQTNINLNDISNDHIKFPVEEMHISVNLTDDDAKLNEKYNNFIRQSINIFGSFENLDKCRVGDTKLNISAEDFRQQFAIENGWSYELDTKLDFNKEIDKLYNPNALYERASLVYNIIRERTNLCSDNKNKFEKVVELINELKDKRILIVSKRGEFANAIANYINENTEYVCGEYHDSIPEQYIKDDNGEYITYKSGENKGKLKPFKTQALSTLWLNRFNSNDLYEKINLLSIKNSTDAELKTAINCVIFTSPLGGTTKDFLLRFTNIEFIDKPLKVYILYSENSIEETKLSEIQPEININIIDEKKEIKIDDENGAVYL